MINIIDEKEDYLICEYIDKDSPYVEYKEQLFFKNGNIFIYNEVYYENGAISNRAFVLPKGTVQYGILGIGDIWFLSPLTPQKLHIPSKNDFLRYYKKRQVALASFCALNSCKIKINRARHDIHVLSADGNNLQSHLSKDIFIAYRNV